MMETSGGGFNPTGKLWRATYTFLGQPGIPGVVQGASNVTGNAAKHEFTPLAVHLISEMARRWWTLEIPREVANFGEILLRHAEGVAMQRGTWKYEPPDGPRWADVTVTYHPAG